MKKYFSLKFSSKIIFLLVLTSLQTMSMEQEKPTEFLFAGMHYYEQGKYEKAAQIFKRYAGKPVPVAQPFCLELVKKGYLNSFEPIPFNGEIEEQKKIPHVLYSCSMFPENKKQKK